METAPLFVHCCHCRWCQRESGASFALNAMIEADRVTELGLSPELVNTPSGSGRGQLIARCPSCRVAVWSNYAGAGPLIKFIRVGTLDNPDLLPPDIHIFTASRQPWIVLPEGVPAVAEYYERDNYWSAGSLARRQVLMSRHEDPAERKGYLRYFYRDWRPTRLGRLWSKLFAWVSGLGFLPKLLLTLQTSDRHGGRVNSTILVVVTHEGQRYLVSMLGEGSEWVQNVRAAGGKASIKRGRTQAVQLTEIPSHERAPILKAWTQVATSGRQHLPVAHDAPISAFNAIAGDYPVFRIDQAPSGASAQSRN